MPGRIRSGQFATAMSLPVTISSGQSRFSRKLLRLACAWISLGVLSPAFAAPATASTQPAKTFDRFWNVPDLDGDSQPDAARQTSLGWDLHGYSYSLDLRMSACGELSTIQVHTKDPWALHVSFRDVDGDSDLDLVVTGGLFHQPVGVWLNDGGEFTQAADSGSAFSSAARGTFLEERFPEPLPHFAALQARTAPLAVPASIEGQIALPRSGLPSGRSLSTALCTIASQSSPRAPPRS